jgi:electron transfer flavoprotein beta subunit
MAAAHRRQQARCREQDASFEMNEPTRTRSKKRCGCGKSTAAKLSSARPARRASQVLREALARGADRAITSRTIALTSVGADPFVVAGALAEAVRGDGFDLVLTGLQSDDQGTAQTGVILAERLGVPHATIVMDVQVQESSVRVKRELEGGWFQWVAMPLPAVITIQSGINQLRYATLKGIMAAKKKEIRKVTPALPPPRTTIVGLDVPRKTKQTRIIPGPPAEAAKELVRALKDEARVIG